MNWEAIGAVGEVVGAVAVIATILYLAAQVRMSNRFEAANHQDIHMDRIRERMLVLAQDGELSQIVRTAAQGGELTDAELARARSFASHRIITQRDAWARAKVLGRMPGLSEPEHYLDILVEEMKRDQCLLRQWKVVSPMAVAWQQEFKDYIDQRLVELGL